VEFGVRAHGLASTAVWTYYSAGKRQIENQKPQQQPLYGRKTWCEPRSAAEK